MPESWNSRMTSFPTEIVSIVLLFHTKDDVAIRHWPDMCFLFLLMPLIQLPPLTQTPWDLNHFLLVVGSRGNNLFGTMQE